jgi:uncharacterized protein (DUF305 family)
MRLHGQQFDLMFIDLMISHHRGAIDMARTEFAHGQDAKVKEVATAVIAAQQQEINQLAKRRKAWAGFEQLG